MYNIIFKFILTTLFVYLSDKTLLVLFGDISRWFQLHLIGNMLICYFSGQNLLQLTKFKNIQTLVEYDDNTIMCCIITFILHLYHTLFFKLTNTM